MVSQCQIKNSYRPDTKTCQKPYKFGLEVKVQGPIWIMNVHDTYTRMPNMVSKFQTKKKLLAGHESAHSDGQTEGFLYTP